MKKIFAVILSLVYLSSSIGTTVHMHYCMDKFVNWSLNAEGDKCTNCGMEKDGNCCRDESKFVKNSLDQSATGAIQLLQIPATESRISPINIAHNCSFCYVNEYPTIDVPPASSGVGILIRNCVFRI